MYINLSSNIDCWKLCARRRDKRSVYCAGSLRPIAAGIWQRPAYDYCILLRFLYDVLVFILWIEVHKLSFRHPKGQVLQLFLSRNVGCGCNDPIRHSCESDGHGLRIDGLAKYDSADIALSKSQG